MSAEQANPTGEQEPTWPPKPLEHEWFLWYAGEWKGFIESPMGKSESWQKCELAFGGQFLTISYKDQSAPGGYEAYGLVTLNDKDEVVGYWIDNMRTMCEGKGRLQGTKLIMEWKDPSNTITRTVERVSEDLSVETFALEGQDGSKVEGRAEMTRVK